MTNKDVIDKVLEYHPLITGYNGCDGYKSGNPEDLCTGIVTALVPTIDVIKKTAELGASLLFVHEPSYYMTPDYPDWHSDIPNSVYEEKRRLLEKHHITIWRDDDHIHCHQPDGIFTGVMKYLGWGPYYIKEHADLPAYFPFEIPPVRIDELRQFLMDKLHLNGLAYIGKPETKITRIPIVAHLYPCAVGDATEDANGNYHDYAVSLIQEMEKPNGPQAIIPGEIVQWHVLSYVRDAVSLGRDMACFNVGHFNIEELGMRYAKDWLTELTGNTLPVTYVPTGDIFQF